ncbi:MAG: Rnf-Nqr domain containing protein [Gammaproteobacteria bacterium]|nr:Rnf-Nqr domain containing protein [Gammaproteobacteria bacterium]
MTEFLSIVIAAAVVNNLVLVQFLGVTAFYSASSRLQNSLEIALLTAAVLVTASLLNLLLTNYVLSPLDLMFLQLICFVAVSGSITVLILHWLREKFPVSLRRLHLHLLLVGGNSAVIGISIINTRNGLGLIENIANSIGAALGFALVLIAFAALRQRLDTADVPQPFRGPAIHLISAGIIAMCFLGFAGLV